MNDEVKRYWTAELWDNEETQDAMVVLAADYEALQAKLAECQHTVRVLESSEEDAQQAAVKFKTERDEWKRRAKEKDRQHEIECLEAEVDRLKIELGNALRQEDAEHSREEVSINLDQLPFEVKPEDEPNLMSWHAAMELFEDDPNGWRLPTKDELYLIYKHRDKIGGFAAGDYWSSSEYSSSFAWYQPFTTGFQYDYGKHYNLRVRAVRETTEAKPETCWWDVVEKGTYWTSCGWPVLRKDNVQRYGGICPFCSRPIEIVNEEVEGVRNT